MPNPCPPIGELERIALGEPSDVWLDHTQSCKVCRQRIEEILANNRLIDEVALAGRHQHLEHATRQPLPEVEGYELVGELQRGGQGLVYEAIQLNTNRRVAIKVLLAGALATERQRRRFDREVELLANMDHPNVVTVFESGSTKDGQHYLAMELIRGTPLTSHAEGNELGMDDRVRLMIDVADAVQFAHQRGVIHRDLKPGNILVDDAERVKVLDFGVACVTDSDIQSTTLDADAGQLIGTLPYMSPEQCQADPSLLDSRSDVYALGVVTYELLGGCLPHDLSGKRVFEAARTIIEDDPLPLSDVDRSLRGDLATIVSMALEKDPARRYQSAAAFGDDLQRFLDGQAIVAHPPSVLYQFGKLARRNKAVVGSIMAVVLMLCLGLAGTIWQAVSAIGARDDAQAASRFMQEMIATIDRRDLGHDVSMKEVLDRSSPRIAEQLAGRPLVEAPLHDAFGLAYLELGENDSAANHLQRSANIYMKELGPDHPRTLETICDLAVVYRNQRNLSESALLLQRAWTIRQDTLGAHARETLATKSQLGNVYTLQGKLEESESLLLETLDQQRLHLDAQDTTIYQTMSRLGILYLEQGRYQAIAPYLQDWLDTRANSHNNTSGVSDPFIEEWATLLETATAEQAEKVRVLGFAGRLHMRKSRYQEAARLFELVSNLARRQLGDEHPDTLLAMNDLAQAYKTLGQYDQAEPLYVHVAEVHGRTMGEDHPNTLTVLGNLASLYKAQLHHDKAEPLYEQVLEATRSRQGNKHPHTVRAMHNLAMLHRAQRRYQDAVPLFEESIRIKREILGDEHQDTLISEGMLARTYQALERPQEALELAERSMGSFERRLGQDHALTQVARMTLAYVYRSQDRFDEAETLLLQALSGRSRIFGDEHRKTLDVHSDLARVYQDAGRLEEAAMSARHVMEQMRQTLGPDNTRTLSATSRLASIQIDRGQYEDAEALLVDAADSLMTKRGQSDRYSQQVITTLVELYTKWDQPDHRETWAARLSN